MLQAPSQLSNIDRINNVPSLIGLTSLWQETLGDSQICIAVIDGPVDESHICFNGAQLNRLPTMVSEKAGDGRMSRHGTHVTSIIFGQHESPIHGIAPRCRGLILPSFSDTCRLSQLNLARAINQAVEQGAQIINISGGQMAQLSRADAMLVKAVQFCEDKGVLIVASAGNDGCDCLHVPAALPSVLAVGAMSTQGLPFDFSNWGETYQTQGILAHGENILGALPGGDAALMSGTSFATPIVTGIVALLLCIQQKLGHEPDPHVVRSALLKSAIPCDPKSISDCRRYLVGSLNIPGAYALINKGEFKEMSRSNRSNCDSKPSFDTAKYMSLQGASEEMLQPNVVSNDPSQTEIIGYQRVNELAQDKVLPPIQQQPEVGVETAMPVMGNSYVVPSNQVMVPMMNGDKGIVLVPVMQELSSNVAPSQISFNKSSNAVSAQAIPGITPSGDCSCNNSTGITAAASNPSAPKSIAYATPRSLVYALGTLGYDFGTEARRDSFRQLIPQEPGQPPPNPYVAQTMLQYLNSNPWEASSLIWVLYIELSPIYAIEPEGPFANDIYQRLREYLAGQILPEDDLNYIERVSIPGVMPGGKVKLFSGEEVPIIVPELRSFYSWNVNALIDLALQTQELTDEEMTTIRPGLRKFLDKLYYELRNLGQTQEERALNFAATNIFQAVQVFAQALRGNYQFDRIIVEPSPFCRLNSICLDVKLNFFNPENTDMARKVYRFTVDVSDKVPVSVGRVRDWESSF